MIGPNILPLRTRFIPAFELAMTICRGALMFPALPEKPPSGGMAIGPNWLRLCYAVSQFRKNSTSFETAGVT
jgi:hypothetical protein